MTEQWKIDAKAEAEALDVLQPKLTRVCPPTFEVHRHSRQVLEVRRPGGTDEVVCITATHEGPDGARTSTITFDIARRVGDEYFEGFPLVAGDEAIAGAVFDLARRLA